MRGLAIFNLSSPRSRVSCALSEAEVHWRVYLNGLKERGIGIPSLVTSDAHSGLKAALKAALNGTPWQRCQFHLQLPNPTTIAVTT